MNLTKREKQIPEEFKALAKDFSEKGFITTSFENLVIGLEQDRFIG